jgi:hypothetical protein
LVACIALVASTAAAQDGVPSAAERTAAREAYTAGVAAANAGDWETAHAEFSRSYGLFAHPRTLLNLAGAQAQTGRLVEASESYREYLRDAEAYGEDAASQVAARAELAELEPRLPRATFHVTDLLDDDHLRLDATELSHAVVGTPLPVDPGDHRVSVLRLTEEVIGRDFTVAEGDRLEIELVVPAPPPPPPEDEVVPRNDDDLQVVVGGPPRDDVDAEGSPLTKWWFWTIAGAVVITGIITTGVVIASAGDDPYPGNVAGGPYTVNQR